MPKTNTPNTQSKIRSNNFRYRWLKDGKDYEPIGYAGRVAVQPGVGTLIFYDPLKRDEGFYECVAENIMGSAISIKSYLRVSCEYGMCELFILVKKR